MYEGRPTPTPAELREEMDLERRKKHVDLEPGLSILDELERRAAIALAQMKAAIGIGCDEHVELIVSPTPPNPHPGHK